MLQIHKQDRGIGSVHNFILTVVIVTRKWFMSGPLIKVHCIKAFRQFSFDQVKRKELYSRILSIIVFKYLSFIFKENELSKKNLRLLITRKCVHFAKNS